MNLTSAETRMIVLSDSEDYIFVRLDKTSELADRQTDRQTDLPWLLQRVKQCGRAVKTLNDSFISNDDTEYYPIF